MKILNWSLTAIVYKKKSALLIIIKQRIFWVCLGSSAGYREFGSDIEGICIADKFDMKMIQCDTQRLSFCSARLSSLTASMSRPLTSGTASAFSSKA